MTALTIGLMCKRCWALGNTWKQSRREFKLIEVTLFLWSNPFWNGSTPFFSLWAKELGISLRLTHCTPMLGKEAVIVSSFISVIQIPLMHLLPTKLCGWARWGSFSSTHETITRAGPCKIFFDNWTFGLVVYNLYNAWQTGIWCTLTLTPNYRLQRNVRAKKIEILPACLFGLFLYLVTNQPNGRTSTELRCTWCSLNSTGRPSLAFISKPHFIGSWRLYNFYKNSRVLSSSRWLRNVLTYVDEMWING